MSKPWSGCFALLLFLGLASALPAQADYKAGRAAWDSGRHGEAVTQWKAAARARDVRAMLALGRAYAKGLGVPRDFIEAHKWLNLAAGRGSAEGAAERDALAKEMTVEERAEARKLARAWRTAATQPKPQPKPVAPARKAEKPKKPAPAGPPPKRALREAQGLLAQLGYRPGPANGVWRPNSAKAYRAFLGKAGMTPGDALTPAGLRALRRAAKDKAVAARSAGERLHRAVQAGDIDGLKAALKAGANVNARDRRGWTALMHAANKGHTLMLAPLLAAKADPDVRAADGATALFMAAAHGHAEIVSLLMKGGADVAIKGPQGRTAVDIARLRYGNSAVARKKGADPAIIALLNGKSWAQVVAEAKAAAEKKATAEKAAAAARAAKAAAAARAAAVAKAAAEKAAAEETAMKLTPADRRTIQATLAALGHKPGPADGLFGPATRSALRSWQKAQGLTPTGRVNPATASRLQAAAEKAAREKAALARLDRDWPAGKTFRDCVDCPEMAVIPPGRFTMGSPSHEEGRSKDEGPQRQVTIPRRFAVGKYEVTRGEFARFVAATGHATGNSCWTYEGGEWQERSGRGWRNPAFDQTARDPVVCVSWHDAKAYVSWLSKKTGKRYRLLSEAEWEYAARSGTRTRFHWGDDASVQCSYANGADLAVKDRYGWSGAAICRDGHVHTAPVGSFAANRFGLHDMHGNVWEWVEDCWHESYRGAPPVGRAWTAGGDCGKRVLRGGSWSNGTGLPPRRDPQQVLGRRAAINDSLGFRVARTLTP